MPYTFYNPKTGVMSPAIKDSRVQEWLDAEWVQQNYAANGNDLTPPASSSASGGAYIAPELATFYKDLDVAFRDREIDISEYRAGIEHLNSLNSQYSTEGNLALGAAGLYAGLQGPSGVAASMELMRGQAGAGGGQVFKAIQGAVPLQYKDWQQRDLKPRNPRNFLSSAFEAAGMGSGGAAGAGGGAGAGAAAAGGASVSVNGQQVAGQGMPTATGGTFDPSVTSPANKANPGIYQPYADAPPMGTYAYGAAAPSRGQMGAPDAESRDLTGYGYNRGEADDPIGNPRRYLETLAQMYPGTVVDPIDSEGNLVGPTWDAYGRPIKPDGDTRYWPRMPQDEMESFYFEEWVKSGMEAMPAYEYPAPNETEEQFLDRTRGTAKYPAWALERDAAESAQAGQQTAAGGLPVSAADQAMDAAEAAANPHPQGSKEYYQWQTDQVLAAQGANAKVPAAPPATTPAAPAAATPAGNEAYIDEQGVVRTRPIGSATTPVEPLGQTQSQKKLLVPGQPPAAKPVWRPSTLPATAPNPALQQDPNKPTGDPFFDAPRTRPEYNVARTALPGRGGTNAQADSGNTSSSGSTQSSSGRATGGGDSRNFGGQTGAHENAASRRRAMGGLDVVTPGGVPTNPLPPGVPAGAQGPTNADFGNQGDRNTYVDPQGGVYVEQDDGSYVPLDEHRQPHDGMQFNPNAQLDPSQVDDQRQRALGGLDVVTDETRFEHGGQKFLTGEKGRDELVARSKNHVAVYPLEQPGIPVPPAAADTANDLVPGSPYEARGGGQPTPPWMHRAMVPDGGRMPAGVSPETGEPLFLELVTATGEPYLPQGTETPPSGNEGASAVAGPSPESSTPIPMASGGIVDLKGDVTGKPPKVKAPKPPKGGPVVPGITPPAPVPSQYAIAPSAKVYQANRPFNLSSLDAATQQHYAGAKGLEAKWKPATPKAGSKNAPIPGAEPVKPVYLNDAGQVDAATGANKFKLLPAFENIGLESQNHWQASAIRNMGAAELEAFQAMLKAKGVPPGALEAFQKSLGKQQIPAWLGRRAF